MINIVWNVNYCEYVFKAGDPSTAVLSNLHWDCNGEDDVTLNTARNIGTQGVLDQDVEEPSATVDQTAQQTLLDMLFLALGPEKDDIEQSVKDEINALNNPTGGGFVPPPAP